ncbi:MAG: hypothetical protein LBL63_02100, partial [Clostridiales Family XIII bacterium]|nr:hypothetical protein [Clostridiales Family XIII bacterium]
MGAERNANGGRHSARRLVSMIFSFFLTLAFIALTAVLVLQLTLFRPSFMLEQVDESTYAAEITSDVENTLVSYGMSGGFDEAFFENLLTEDEIRADLFLEVERLYDPDLPGVDIEDFRAGLYEKMCVYVTEHGETVSPEMEEALRYLTDICTEAYGKGVAIPFSAQLSPILVKLQKFVLPAIIALILFIIVIAAFLIGIQRFKYRAWMYVIYALTASGVFFIVLASVALNTDRFERIGISGQGLYELVVAYMTNIFDP